MYDSNSGLGMKEAGGKRGKGKLEDPAPTIGQKERLFLGGTARDQSARGITSSGYVGRKERGRIEAMRFFPDPRLFCSSRSATHLPSQLDADRFFPSEPGAAGLDDSELPCR